MFSKYIKILAVVIVVIGIAFAASTTTTRSTFAQQGPINSYYFPFIGVGPTPLITDEATQRISVPPGFRIHIFAQSLSTPRFMAFGPDGALYVSLMGAGQIARLPDANHNELADTNQIAASGLTSPHGVEWHNDGTYDWLYVAEADKVERLRDSDGNGSLDIKQLVTNNIPCCGGHSSRTVHFGPDGKMYVSAGSSCNYCTETDPRRAAILRFNADGTIPSDNPFQSDADTRKQALWAWGLRNSVDFLFTPSNELWADMNGSDGLGDAVPPEEIVINVQGNKSHGWPYCYTPVLGANPAPQTAEVRDTRIALPPGFDCSQAVPALFTDLAHSAPLGMTFASGTNFPALYRNDLYVAFHGSWNTDVVANYRDCKVQRVVMSSGQPASSQTFATGWRAPGAKCGDASTWGRPADVIFGPDGKMYISDDMGGRVYIVSYVGL